MQTAIVTETHRLSPHSNVVVPVMPGTEPKDPKPQPKSRPL